VCIATGTEGSNAFFKCEQAFVDLCAFETALAIVRHCVGGSFRAGKIYEVKASGKVTVVD
jgi:hypothetical protein